MLGTEVIYARALAFSHVNPDFDIEKLLTFELAPHPTSIFDKDGLMHMCKQKSSMI